MFPPLAECWLKFEGLIGQGVPWGEPKEWRGDTRPRDPVGRSIPLIADRPMRRDATYCMNPSVSVCMKLTIASSSASERPKRPTRLVFMLSVDSGAGQHVVLSPTSWDWQRGRTSRVLLKCTIPFRI